MGRLSPTLWSTLNPRLSQIATLGRRWSKFLKHKQAVRLFLIRICRIHGVHLSSHPHTEKSLPILPTSQDFLSKPYKSALKYIACFPFIDDLIRVRNGPNCTKHFAVANPSRTCSNLLLRLKVDGTRPRIFAKASATLDYESIRRTKRNSSFRKV